MSITKKNKSTRKWWIIGLISTLVLLVAAAIIKAKTKPKGEEVVTEKVMRRDITEKVTASGKIYPETEIKISSDVSGEVVELFVKEGDSVKAGQILARVNPDNYQSAVERSSAGVNAARSSASAIKNNIESAKSSRDQAKSQYQFALKTHERNQQLFKEGIISKADLESSETQLNNAAAALKSAETAVLSASKNAESSSYQVKDAEAALKETRTNLGRTIIKAPASGIISKLNIEKGERVVGTIQMTGTEMMRIADLGAMEVQVEVSENDIVHVKQGQEAEIEVDAYENRLFVGHVTEVANSASNISSLGLNSDQVTKFVVKVRIDKDSYKDLVQNNRSAPFKPGMSATVAIKTSSVKNVISIPIQAVTAYDPELEKNKDEIKKQKELANGEPEGLVKEEKKDVRQNQFKEAVFITSADTVTRIDITTGVQDQKYIEVVNGLTDDQEIVIGPYAAISKKLKTGTNFHRKKEEH